MEKKDKIDFIGCSVCRTTMGIYTPSVAQHDVDKDSFGLCMHHHSGFLGINYIGKDRWESMFGTTAWHTAITNKIIEGLH